MRLFTKLLATVCLVTTAPAVAADIPLNFTGSGVPAISLPLGPLVFTGYDLVNTATGDDTVDFSLTVGDHIVGALQLAHAVTVPASDIFSLVDIGLGADDSSQLQSFIYDADVHFFDGATEIVPPYFLFDSSSLSSLDIGGGALGSPAPRFSFDRIVFDLTTTGLFDQNGDPVTSGSFSGSGAGLLTLAVPTPEPSVWLLMIVGFGAIGAQLRRRPRPDAATAQA
jgi:hypothetical protein